MYLIERNVKQIFLKYYQIGVLAGLDRPEPVIHVHLICVVYRIASYAVID